MRVKRKVVDNISNTSTGFVFVLMPGLDLSVFFTNDSFFPQKLLPGVLLQGHRYVNSLQNFTKGLQRILTIGLEKVDHKYNWD